MDAVRIQDGVAAEIWRDTTKMTVCYKVHDGETDARPIFTQEIIDSIVDTDDTVEEGYVWDGAHFKPPG